MHAAIIVGAGFSGLAAGIQLKRAGIHDFVIVEKADRVGGTWRENTYPGAACDVPSHLYSYSFEPNPSWSRTYGLQAEILAYLEHCATKYELRPHLRFGAAVRAARFDEAAGTWHVTVGDEVLIARALILGNGALHVPQVPAIAGLDTFEGTHFHSARWNHDFDFTGKRVAAIGTGASAIQFVPQLAKLAAQLHVFQRTPPWILPKVDRVVSRRERWAFANLPAAHWLRRTGLYWSMESRVVPLVYAPKLLAIAESLLMRSLARDVADPTLRAKLTPHYRLGCKRILLSSEYYPALQRPNVELVTDAIESITPRGIRTADGRERELDAIVLGTGFRVTEYLSAIRIHGRGGQELNDEWKSSLRNYLGITVSGFPNLFLLMGPNTGLGHNSMIFMIEAQARYAAAAVRTLRERNLAFIDVRPDVERAFRASLSRRLKHSVWMSGCTSWYQLPDGEVFLWPGASIDYWRRTRSLDLSHYDLGTVSS